MTGAPAERSRGNNIIFYVLHSLLWYLIANIINSKIYSVDGLYGWGNEYIVYITRSQIIIHTILLGLY